LSDATDPGKHRPTGFASLLLLVVAVVVVVVVVVVVAVVVVVVVVVCSLPQSVLEFLPRSAISAGFAQLPC
jgi:Flp pilus assembly protein TadB